MPLWGPNPQFGLTTLEPYFSAIHKITNVFGFVLQHLAESTTEQAYFV